MEGNTLARGRAENRNLAPQARQDWLAPLPSLSGPASVQALRDEVNRLFDSVFRSFGQPAKDPAWPSLEVREADGEYKVIAELPGLDEKDVEVILRDGVLSIRGEKRSEVDDKDRKFTERYYGRFERQIALGDVDEDKVSATFDKGVLTVTAPKSPLAETKTKRIPINSGNTVH